MKTNQKSQNPKPRRNPKQGDQKDNYQDKFADRERQKGEKFAMRSVLKSLGKDNTPSWYFKDKQVLSDTASFSFTNPLGEPLTGVTTRSDDTRVIPGLLVIPLAITPGISVDAQSPINLAAQDLYSTVRYKNSGAANYDPPDLMLYCIGLDSIYTAWNWMKRIYGYASTYSSQNKYKPAAYAYAENVDLEDIHKHLADFRRYLNVAASRISAFACPATFTYNVRHSWLFSNIYKDANTRKAQEYMYTPLYFYQFDETSSPKGGILTPVNVNFGRSPSAYWNYERLMTMMNGMINAMQYSSDNGNMSGDIIKQFGDNIFRLSNVEPDYRVDSVYSEEVLSQMENSREALFGTGVQLSDFTISQEPDTNFITFTMDLKNGSTVPSENYLLNFHKDSITPEDVIVASRLIYSGSPGASSPSWNIESCGSELAGEFYIVGYNYNPTTRVRTLTRYNSSVCIVPNVAALPTAIPKLVDFLWLWQSFDWAPNIRLNVAYTEGKGTLSPWFKDYDMFTNISTANIEAMNELALLSEFNMPN